MSAVAPTINDLYAIGLAELQSRQPSLTVADGDVTQADLHAACSMADAVIGFVVSLFKATWIETSLGPDENQDGSDDLGYLCNDRLNIQRLPATKAQVDLTFTRTSNGAAGTIPSGTSVSSNPDPDGQIITFTTDADLAITVGSNGPFLVSGTCQVIGPSGNIKTGQLVNISGSLFDSTFSVTNATTAGGGNLAESSDSLRIRARAQWQALRAGTIGALEFGAKEVPSVRNVAVIENTTSGIVNVVVSDSDGNSTLEMLLDTTVEMENWRSAGVLVQPVGGIQTLIDITMSLVTRTGFDVASANQTLVAAASARIGRLNGEDTFSLDMVRGAVIAQYPDDVLVVRFNYIAVGGVPIVGIFPEEIPASVGQVFRAGSIVIQAA